MLPDARLAISGLLFLTRIHRESLRRNIELEEQGCRLLLDWQNPGGILGESVRVAQYLVPKGPIVSVIDREGRKYTEESYLEQVKYPLAVLVDHGSASASEIVAGAVQDTKSGKLFGTRTFGKGSVQTVYRLPQNTGLKLTTAKYYTPSGRSINGTGITPDEVVELPEQPTKDIQLETAENYLRNLQKY
ncbi:MAG: S41 family peptidase [Phascolarctobacterium faecium]